MAEVNRFLFLDPSGEAIHFYMPPCKERARLKPLIEDRGGTISSKVESECIRLAVPGQRVHGDNLVLSKYVTDCVDADDLLDVASYRIDPATAPPEDGEVVSDFETDFGPTTRVKSSVRQGRQKYLLSEDMKIIRYILDEHLYKETNGNKMWQEMAVLKIVNHPWQSIKDRFRKQILPYIQSYQVTRYEKALLTNTFLGEEDMDNSKSDSGNETRTSPRKHSEASRKKRTKDPNQKTIDSGYKEKRPKLLSDVIVEFDEFDQELLAMADEETDTLRNEKEKLSTPTKQNVVNNTNTNNLQHNIDMNSMGSENKSNDESGKSKRKDSEKSEENPGEGSKSKGLLKDKPTPEKGDSAEKNTKSKGEKNASKKTTDGASSSVSKETTKASPEDIFNAARAAFQGLVSAKERSRRQSEETDNSTVSGPDKERVRRSPRKQLICDEPAENAREAAASKNKRTCTEEVVNTEPEAKVKKAEDMEVDCDKEEESQSVISPLKVKKLQFVRPESDIPGPSNKNNNALEQDSQPHGKSRSVTNVLKKFVCDAAASQPDTQSPEEVDRSELVKAERKLKKACRWLGIQREELLSVLWTTSGDLNDAIRWILTGGSGTVPVWSLEDDDRLQSANPAHLVELTKRFGEDAIGDRLVFLAENLDSNTSSQSS